MYVFTDCRMSKQALHTLSSFGHVPVLCTPHPALDPAVASHPDMLLFPFEQGILVHREHSFDVQDIPLFPISQAPERKYPRDVLLNAARIGNYLICRKDALATELLQYAEKRGLHILSVAQGYAKCNVCAISEHAAITEDASIAAALRQVGIDVLYVPAGEVALPGYPYGFIGGASGSDGAHVFFCGDLTKHSLGKQIDAFCRQYGKQPVSLALHPLHDVGSLLFYNKE